MNKKGEFVYWMFGVMMIIGVLSLVFIWTMVPYIEGKDLSKFCVEQGYDSGDYGQTIFRESYCIKQEGTNIIKIEVEGCDESWCFVNKEIKG